MNHTLLSRDKKPDAKKKSLN